MTMNVQDSMAKIVFMVNIWRKQAKKLIDLRSNQKMARTLRMTVRQTTGLGHGQLWDEGSPSLQGGRDRLPQIMPGNLA